MPTATGPRAVLALTEPLAELLGIGTRPIPRPACMGMAPLHDESVWGETVEQRDQRHARALRVCAGCPAHNACAAAAASLPRHAGGVWAGVLLGDDRHRAAPR